MTARTPGPWEVGAGDDYYIRAESYPKAFPHTFKNDDLGDYLALVGNRAKDFGEANAHLIAAAPELMDALKKLLDRYHVMGCGDGPEALEAARVLAKASGLELPNGDRGSAA